MHITPGSFSFAIEGEELQRAKRIVVTVGLDHAANNQGGHAQSLGSQVSVKVEREFFNVLEEGVSEPKPECLVEELHPTLSFNDETWNPDLDALDESHTTSAASTTPSVEPVQFSLPTPSCPHPPVSYDIDRETERLPPIPDHLRARKCYYGLEFTDDSYDKYLAHHGITAPTSSLPRMMNKWRVARNCIYELGLMCLARHEPGAGGMRPLVPLPPDVSYEDIIWFAFYDFGVDRNTRPTSAKIALLQEKLFIEQLPRWIPLR